MSARNYNEKDPQVKFLKAQMQEGAIDFEADRAIKWKSSGNYIPQDACKILAWLGLEFNAEATAKKREAQTQAFLSKYRERMKNYVPSEEEMAEMRAAFGPGEVVVNVITGQRYQL